MAKASAVRPPRGSRAGAGSQEEGATGDDDGGDPHLEEAARLASRHGQWNPGEEPRSVPPPGSRRVEGEGPVTSPLHDTAPTGRTGTRGMSRRSEWSVTTGPTRPQSRFVSDEEAATTHRVQSRRHGDGALYVVHDSDRAQDAPPERQALGTPQAQLKGPGRRAAQTQAQTQAQAQARSPPPRKGKGENGKRSSEEAGRRWVGASGQGPSLVDDLEKGKQLEEDWMRKQARVQQRKARNAQQQQRTRRADENPYALLEPTAGADGRLPAMRDSWMAGGKGASPAAREVQVAGVAPSRAAYRMGKAGGGMQRYETMDGYLHGRHDYRTQLQARAAVEEEAKQRTGHYDRLEEPGEDLPPGAREDHFNKHVVVPNASTRGTSGYHGRVLLVEEDAEVMRHARGLLESRGYIVTTADDGPRALELTRTTQFDVMLLSRHLPTLSGVELTRIVRQREDRGLPAGRHRLPIVAFAHETDEADLRLYMEVGMDGCISKPVDEGSLLTTVSAAVPHHNPGPGMREGGHTSIADALSEDLHTTGAGGRSRTSLPGPTPSPLGTTTDSLGLLPSPVSAPSPSASVPAGTGLSAVRSRGRGPAQGRQSRQQRGGSSRRSRGRVVGPQAGASPAIVLPGELNTAAEGAQGKSEAVAASLLPASLGGAPSGGDGVTTGSGDGDVAFSGVYQHDDFTAMPFTVMGRPPPPGAATGHGVGSRLARLVVVQDIFDTCERMQIVFRELVRAYPGVQVLLFNYPGQAFTEWRADCLLNNRYLAECMEGLMRHLNAVQGPSHFPTAGSGGAGFFVLGFGNGGNIATMHAMQHPRPNCRGLILLNSFAHVDAHLAGVLHDSMNVFSCSPPSRPDLPVYFFTRFLFSAGYLKKVTTPLALNLYTAVHNPISLQGRIQLCQGALAHVDLRRELDSLTVPMVLLQGTQDALVKPQHCETLVRTRAAEVRTVQKCLTSRKRAVVVWLRAGHELFQEAKRPVLSLMEQLLTGYHDKHDVAFVPASSSSAPGAGATSPQGKAQLKGSASAPTVGPRAGEVFEDRFIDTVLGNLQAARTDATGAAAAAAATHSGGGSQLNTVTDPAARAKMRLKELESQQEEDKLQEYQRQVRKQLREEHKASDAGGTGGRRSKAGRRGSGGGGGAGYSPTSPAGRARRPSALSQDVRQAKEVKEYMSWRVRRNKKRLERLEQAGVQIQKAWRAYLSKTMVKRMRVARAAATVQRVWRGYLGRQEYAQRKRELWAVLVVQRAWRGHAGRSVHRHRQERQWAATSIQRVYRGRMAKRRAWGLRAAREKAAVQIQTLFRGRRARRSAWVERDKRNAAIDIQRLFRGYKGRRRARQERDKFLFSKTQSEGIEFGRQMLVEHKSHASKLQSEVVLLSKEKAETEHQVEQLLQEIAEFEMGVRALEREMQDLNRVEAESTGALDEEAKTKLREQKMRLDREFGAMLTKIADRRERLQVYETKLQKLDKARQLKEADLRDLERKLVVLLEEQQQELDSIKKRQEQRGEKTLSDPERALAMTEEEGRGGGSPSAASRASGRGSAGGGGGGGSTALALHKKREVSNMLQSTETMMKFGFMSMSLTYFSSLNMVRAMRTLGAEDVAMPQLPAGAGAGEEGGGGGGAAGGGGGAAVPGGFMPKPKAGDLPGERLLHVAAWTVEDVASWLGTLKLGMYREAFVDAAIDGAFLFDLNDEDLRNTLGIEHALHRKKILNSIRRLRRVEEQQRAAVANGATPAEAIARATGEPGVGPVSVAAGRSGASVTTAGALVGPAGFGDEEEEGTPALGSPATPALGGAVPTASFRELTTWVRHGKLQKVRQALQSVREELFDRSTVTAQYLPDYGTQYDEGTNRKRFHINMVDDKGNTLLTTAAQNGKLKMAKLLVSKGANPNHQNVRCRTAAGPPLRLL